MRLAAILIICGTLASAAGQCQNYSLEDCLAAATMYNPTLQKSRNNLSSANVDKRAAVFNLLPSLDFSAEHILADGKNIDPVTNDFIRDQFSGGALEMRFVLNIFSGFSAINAVKAGVYRSKAEEYAGRKALLDLQTSITVAYARAIYSQEQIGTIEKNSLSTRSEAAIIQEKINVGKLSKSDLYPIDSRYKSELADLAAEKNNLAAALGELRHAIGLSYGAPLTIEDLDTNEIRLILQEHFMPADILAGIVEKHPALLASKANEMFAAANVRVAKGHLFPTVSVAGNLFSNYNLIDRNAGEPKTSFNQQLRNNYGRSVALVVQIPLLAKMQNRLSIEKEKLHLAGARLETREMTSQLYKDVERLLTDFSAARERYLLQSQSLAQAEMSYTAYDERHRLGLISSLELILAKDQLREIQVKATAAKFDLYFKYKLIRILLNAVK